MASEVVRARMLRSGATRWNEVGASEGEACRADGRTEARHACFRRVTGLVQAYIYGLCVSHSLILSCAPVGELV